MAGTYSASPKDLLAIEEALRFVWHPKMSFVFRDKARISNTVVISYDSKFIYLWTKKRLQSIKNQATKLEGYNKYKLPRTLKIKRKWQYAWRAGLWHKDIEKALPSEIKKASLFDIPRISGGLLTPFIKLQKQRKPNNWPYTTYESYLATIIHEFGHVYWNSFKMWWPSDKKENLSYLTYAKNLFQEKTITTKNSLNFPAPQAFGETFAYCTECYASTIFWPSHKNLLDAFAKCRLEGLIKEEKKKDLDHEDSVLEPTINPHNFASVFGSIILNKYPTNWPEILTNPTILKLHL